VHAVLTFQKARGSCAVDCNSVVGDWSGPSWLWAMLVMVVAVCYVVTQLCCIPVDEVQLTLPASDVPADCGGFDGQHDCDTQVNNDVSCSFPT